MIFFTANTVSELVCFLGALIFLYKDKDPVWRLMILFLMATCVTEFTGVYLRNKHISNLAIYNVYLIIECGFTSYFFYHLYKNYAHKLKWLVVWLVFFGAMYITEMLIIHFNDFAAVSAVVMSVVFVLASLLYYYSKLRDEQFEPLLLSAAFWWVSGALVFYFGSTACNLFFNFLKEYEYSSIGRSTRYIIFIILNILLYSFWLFSFICRYLQRKSYS
jgi:hypothetical protein